MADQEIEPQETADMADSLPSQEPDIAVEAPAPSPPPSIEETDAFASHSSAPQPDGSSKRQRRPNVRLNEIGDGPLANVVGYFLKRKGAARTTKPPSTSLPSPASGKPSKRSKIFHKFRDPEDESLDERGGDAAAAAAATTAAEDEEIEEDEENLPRKPFPKRPLNSKRKSGLSKVPYSKANLSKKQQQANTRPHHRSDTTNNSRSLHLSDPGITIRPLHHPEARNNSRPHHHLEDGFVEAADGGVYGCSDTDKQARSQSPPPNYDDAHPAGSSFESDSPKGLQKNPPSKQTKKKMNASGPRLPSAGGYAAKEDAEEKEEPSSSDVQELRMQIPTWERTLPALDEKVRDWMKSIGLEKYALVFQHHEVTNDVLPLLTMDDLKEMSISAVGARRKLFTEIVKLRQALLLVDETLSDGK